MPETESIKNANKYYLKSKPSKFADTEKDRTLNSEIFAIKNIDTGEILDIRE